MTKPVRIQLSRRKGFDLQAISRETNGLPAVTVARPGRWGNPFNLRAESHCWTALAVGFRADRAGRHAASVELFRQWLSGQRAFKYQGRIMAGRAVAAASPEITALTPPTAAEIRRKLRGKNLAGWCAPDQPCHADVLLELANR